MSSQLKLWAFRKSHDLVCVAQTKPYEFVQGKLLLILVQDIVTFILLSGYHLKTQCHLTFSIFFFLSENRSSRKLLVANSLYMIPQLEQAEHWKRRLCFLMTLRNLTTYWEKSETNGILFVASLWRGEHECPLLGSLCYPKSNQETVPDSVKIIMKLMHQWQ